MPQRVWVETLLSLIVVPRRPKFTIHLGEPSPLAALQEPPDGPGPPGSAQPAWLVVTYGPEIGRKYELEPGETTLGRDLASDIRIGGSAEDVGDHHATFVNDGERVVVIDQNTDSGTFVNDKRVREHLLAHSDELAVGRTRFRFLADADIHQRYHEEIYRLSTIDPLTRVYNKRYFVHALEGEFAGARDEDGALALVFVDMDRFNQCNDAFGMRVSDRVLRRVAELLRESTRKIDILARYSGQRFVVALPDTELNTALKLAEDMRRRIEKTDFTFDGQHVPITASFGVAARQPGDDYDELATRADAGLHQAKLGGRNRVGFRAAGL